MSRLNLIRLAEVEAIVGFKKSKLYKLIQAGKFPKPRKNGMSSRWVKEEVEAWAEANWIEEDGGEQ